MLLNCFGSLRDVPYDVTAEACIPAMKKAGITRAADVTGMDVLGIPVFMVVRPLSKSLTVSQGKSATAGYARISGIMESLELFHAENIQLPTIVRTLAEAAGDPSFCSIEDIHFRSDVQVDLHRPIEWISANSLVDGNSRFIPKSLCNLDFTRAVSDEFVFSSSNGLASGNSLDEAILHALCEVAERDQLSFWTAAREFGTPNRTRLNLETIGDPTAQALVEKILSADMQLAVWNATGPAGIPCFACSIFDDSHSTLFPQRASGYGCHPLKEVALVRAITEAAQSRLTHIAGSRDDLSFEKYKSDLPTHSSKNSRWYEVVTSESRLSSYDEIDSLNSQQTISDYIREVSMRIIDGSAADILICDLSSRDFNIPVVFCFAPGLEYKLGQAGLSSGRRMMSFMNGLRP